MQELKNKTALITGAGKKSGIGYAMAQKMAAKGANIIIADFGNARDFMADVTDTKTVVQMAETIKSLFPAIDILCNNAGATFGVPNGVHTQDEDAWIKTVDVNLHGVFRVSRAMVPLMEL